MDNSIVQFGFDIATSISIIGAVVSFLISQKKIKQQRKNQFSVSNLKDNLKYIANCKKEYNKLGNELREKVLKADSISRANLLEEHKLKQIFFLEDLKRELDAQVKIYYPIFSQDENIIASIKLLNDELDQILILIKDDNGLIEAMEQIKPLLDEIEKLFVKSLVKLMI